jgi:predicted Zn-dependent protease
MLLKRLLTRVLLVFIVGAGGLSTTGCANDAAIISQANQMHGSLKPAVMTDSVLNSYIQRVGDRIIASAREMHQQGIGPKAHKNEDATWMFSEGMQFHFVNSKTLNAFTTGGNHMYIYTALFQQSRTEDELAAVMAHEFAHVYGRHVHKGMNRQYAALGLALAAGAGGYALGGEDNRETYAGAAAGGAMLASQLVNAGFGRDDEAEADDLGFEFYVRAGYDPDKFGDFFRQMIAKGYDKGSGGFNKYLGSHPPLKDRVAAAERRAAEIPPRVKQQMARPPIATPAEFQALQQRSVDVGRNMPNDTTLAGAQELLQALPRSCLTPVITPEQEQAAQRVEQRVQQQQQKGGAAAQQQPQRVRQTSQAPPSQRISQPKPQGY